MAEVLCWPRPPGSWPGKIGIIPLGSCKIGQGRVGPTAFTAAECQGLVRVPMPGRRSQAADVLKDVSIHVKAGCVP